MTGTQRVAQIFGIVFIAIAVLGFLTTGLSMEGRMDHAEQILGVFPVNLPHNVAHLLIGIWGVIAARRWSAAKLYCQISGIVYLLLAAAAFFTPDLGGMMPIGGNDLFLHAVLGAVLSLVGFTAEEPKGAAAGPVGE